MAAGARKRFTARIGKAVELTSKGIVLFVREPDLERNSISVRIGGRGSRWGVGQEFLEALVREAAGWRSSKSPSMRPASC